MTGELTIHILSYEINFKNKDYIINIIVVPCNLKFGLLSNQGHL
jgi:hypothetical protein